MIALLYIWIYNILMKMLLALNLLITLFYRPSTGQISAWSTYFFAFVPTIISNLWPISLAQIDVGRVLVFSQTLQR